MHRYVFVWPDSNAFVNYDETWGLNLGFMAGPAKCSYCEYGGKKIHDTGGDGYGDNIYCTHTHIYICIYVYSSNNLGWAINYGSHPFMWDRSLTDGSSTLQSSLHNTTTYYYYLIEILTLVRFPRTVVTNVDKYLGIRNKKTRNSVEKYREIPSSLDKMPSLFKIHSPVVMYLKYMNVLFSGLSGINCNCLDPSAQYLSS